MGLSEGPNMSPPGAKHVDRISLFDDEDTFKRPDIELAHGSDSEFGILNSEQDIVTHIISVHDDPTLNPWTLRAFVVGLGLSAFGGVLGKSISFNLRLDTQH